jgi:hypothetical protein
VARFTIADFQLGIENHKSKIENRKSFGILTRRTRQCKGKTLGTPGTRAERSEGV